MITRSQLTTLDFNLGNDIEQKTTKMGKEFLIRHFHIVTRSVEVIKIGLHLERAILPVLPENIASKPKPEKQNIIPENAI